MPDEQTSTGGSVSSGSYVQSLLSPALDSDPGAPTEAAPSADSTAGPETAPAESQAAAEAEPSALPTVEDLIQQYANEMGRDASDPEQRKVLKRIADKELFIRKLQGDNEALKKGMPEQPSAGPQYLTDFERELAGEGEPADAGQPAPPPVQPQPPLPPQPQPQAAQPAPPAQPAPYHDVGDSWKTPEESLTALNDAWTKNDLKGVQEIEMARFRRSFDSQVAPSLLPYVNKMIEQRLQSFVEQELGDIVPEVRRSVSQRRMGESREFAIEQLRKAGASDIDKLFEVDEQGPPIKFGDQEYPNTALNRIIAQHPEIMQIVGMHSDPAKRERQAFISRYKLAYQIYKQGTAGIPAETARALVNTGRNIRQAQNGDRARQAINAGRGATGVGDRTAPTSYVAQLNNLPGEIPFSSLLK